MLEQCIHVTFINKNLFSFFRKEFQITILYVIDFQAALVSFLFILYIFISTSNNGQQQQYNHNNDNWKKKNLSQINHL